MFWTMNTEKREDADNSSGSDARSAVIEKLTAYRIYRTYFAYLF
jgi:hypothetical protein